MPSEITPEEAATAFSSASRIIALHLRRYDLSPPVPRGRAGHRAAASAPGWFAHIIENINQSPLYADRLVHDLTVSARNFVYLGVLRPPDATDVPELVAATVAEDLEFYLLEVFFWFVVARRAPLKQVIENLEPLNFKLLADFLDGCPWHPFFNHLKLFFTASEMDSEQVEICDAVLEDIYRCYQYLLAASEQPATVRAAAAPPPFPNALAGIYFDESFTILHGRRQSALIY